MTTKTKPPSRASMIRQALRLTDPDPEAEAPATRKGRRGSWTRKPRPARRVSALTTLPLLAADPGVIRVVGGLHAELNARVGPVPTGDDSVSRDLSYPAPKLFEARPRPAVRGIRAIEAKFAKAGVRFVLSGDSNYALPVTEAGVMPLDIRAAVEAFLPLWHADAIGAPLGCAFCAEPAVDVAIGGAPMCEVHATGAVA